MWLWIAVTAFALTVLLLTKAAGRRSEVRYRAHHGGGIGSGAGGDAGDGGWGWGWADGGGDGGGDGGE